MCFPDDSGVQCGGMIANANKSDDITPNRSPLIDTDSDKGGHSHSNQTSPPLQYRSATAHITDYSPEWAYPEVSEIINIVIFLNHSILLIGWPINVEF